MSEYVGRALFWLLALFAAAGAWVALVQHWLSLKTPPAERLVATAADGWRISVFRRRASKRRFKEPVLLCHGLAANHHNLDFEPPYSLAHALNEAGFDTYAVDWRGTGASDTPPRFYRRGYTIDDLIEKDAPAVLALIRAEHPGAGIFWVGHSLGGLVGYAAAEAHADLAGLVTLGSPAFFSYRKLVRHAVTVGLLLAWPARFRQRWFSIAVAPFLGHATLPLSDTIINPEHIEPRIQRRAYANVLSSMGHHVLRQFRDWIWNDAFRSYDRATDYRARLGALKTPLLIAAGSKDQLAPPEAVERAYAAAGSADKTLLVFGRAHGDIQEYGHGDLVFGTGAPTEVYPAIARWLEARASAEPGEVS